MKKKIGIRKLISPDCPVLFVCLAVASALCLALAALLGVVYSAAGNLSIGIPAAVLAAVLGGAVLTAAALLVFGPLAKCNAKIFTVILCAAVLVPRILYMLAVKSAPVSDFMHMLDYGVSAANGNFSDYFAQFAVFPTKFASGLVFAGLYKLTEPIMKLVGMDFSDMSVIFNIICSLAFAFILKKFAERFLNTAASRFTAVIFALWPAQIMYTNVPGASEHFFMLLYGGALLLTVKAADAVRKCSDIKGALHAGGVFAAAGLLTGISAMIRPAGAILYMAVAVAMAVFCCFRGGKKRIGVCAAVLAVYIAVSVFAPALIGAAAKPLTGYDISKSSAGFNVMMGTNRQSLGMFNTEDMQIIEENEYDFEKVHAQAFEIGKKRIMSDPAGFARLVWRKYTVMWGDEYYGYYWSMQESLPRELPLGSRAFSLVSEHPRGFKLASEIFYLAVLLLTAAGIVISVTARTKMKEEPWVAASLPMILFMGFMLAHCVLEVQSRYHYPAIALLLPFAALGVQEICDVIIRAKAAINTKRST